MVSIAMLSIIVEHVLFIFVVLVCYFSSDELLHHHSIQSVPWRRAVVDNLCHIILGFMSWLIVISVEDPHRRWPIPCCVLCGLLAGFVDIDHFIMAKSFNLEDALNLPSRPPFHNTTLMLFSIVSMLFLTHFAHQKKLEYVGWIILVAVMSHHFRDALHRGLWLWPIALRPFSQVMCIILGYCFPAFVGFLMSMLYKPNAYQDYANV